ncbi:MAG: hypothetical protein JRJ12_12475 [Deltaproteobacteria bacterium]|nr:hypothetical protein [Deltaproteobacteria bacterium]MBW2073032.1 hypothetical protein [Deltaproteobacteria bacterium]
MSGKTDSGRANQGFILVIDQGTFATRAMAIDRRGRIRAAAFCDVSLYRRGSGCVEQDAAEILSSVQQVVAEVLDSSAVRRFGVSAAGLATQRSSVVAWDKRNGKPLAPMLSWQDRRSVDWLRRLTGYARQIKDCTGLPLSPHYGGSKLRWYLDNVPEVSRASSQNALAMGPLASFLLFHLLQEHPFVVDQANGSRTQLWNIATRTWDPWLLELFGIPAEVLPQCRPISVKYGSLCLADIPLTLANGDQNAALYSLGRPARDTAIINIGTGAFILLPTGSKLFRHPTLLVGLGNSSNGQVEHFVEGTVNGAGAALRWAEAKWHLADVSGKLSAWLARSETPPVFVNTVGGLGSPWWQAGPEPSLIGTGAPWQRAVAVAESILFLLNANLETMEEAGFSVNRLQISGGLARVNGLCQRLANLTGRVVYRPAETEATVRGAAWLAAGCPQRWPKPGRGKFFRPSNDAGLRQRYKRFLQALEQGVRE